MIDEGKIGELMKQGKSFAIKERIVINNEPAAEFWTEYIYKDGKPFDVIMTEFECDHVEHYDEINERYECLLCDALAPIDYTSPDDYDMTDEHGRIKSERIPGDFEGMNQPRYVKNDRLDVIALGYNLKQAGYKMKIERVEVEVIDE